MESIQIHVQPVQQSGSIWRLSASLHGLDEGPSELFYEIDAPGIDRLEPDGAPFLLPLLFEGMRLGRPLVLKDAAVCPMLVEGLQRFQLAWEIARPEQYRAVEIDAALHSSSPVVSAGHDTRISCFSGGLDSAYTLGTWLRRERRKGANQLLAAVMVQGYDIPLSRNREAKIALGQAHRVAGSVGIPLYSVRTNTRFLPLDWMDAHGSGVAGMLHLFQGAFGGGLMPGGLSFAEMNSICGTHPALDPWLSSRHFPITTDGHEAPRGYKTTILKDWPEARQNLRVCTHDTGIAGNCGICRKCVLTKCMMASHRIPLEGTMAGDVTYDQAVRIPLGSVFLDKQLARDTLIQARAEGLENEPWARGLRRALWRHRWVPGWNRRGPVVRGVGLDLTEPVDDESNQAPDDAHDSASKYR
ncbi:MAG: hypothetical protein JRG92_14160 [Deltaproteobacteria bacterium]|nr:hypothetical protein [Deltaproteobacteria bacterium]MBW2695487.1 hypothetical protein [Deltaproteobacteria bacterium]